MKDDDAQARQSGRGRPPQRGPAHLARQVLREMCERSRRSRDAHLSACAVWLADAVCASAEDYDPAALRESLHEKRISTDDLLLVCAPDAAALLGDRWFDSQTSFVDVTIGCARLLCLCREAGSSAWLQPEEPPLMRFLLCTPEGETHLLGPFVLGYSLRRAGYSVRMMSGLDVERICAEVESDDFDAVLLNCGSLDSLAFLKDAIKRLWAGKKRPVLALGGAVLKVQKIDRHEAGVDLVTNDIDDVLRLLGAPEPMPLSGAAE